MTRSRLTGDQVIPALYDQTTLHPIGLIAVFLLGIATLVVPRRYALAPMLIMACFISPAQRIVIASLDFNLLRIMVLFGWLRVIVFAEIRRLEWKRIDTIVILWVVIATVVVTLREATAAAFIYRLGLSFDALGMYFLFRLLIQSWKDLETMMLVAAIISIPVAAVFLIELSTGRNMFAIFGGVPEITVVREGRLRCRGPFSHPILAGCFWAVMMPLIGGLWWSGRWARWFAPIGLVASAIVVFSTASDTPISAVLAGALAAALFPLRRSMRWIRWSTVLGLVALQIVMTNPIWHLFVRVQLVHGSTGWYRFKMIDGFLRNFSEWWILGTKDYSKLWPQPFDSITNQFVLEGVEGGLVTLTLFVVLLALGFHGVGRIVRSVRNSKSRQIMAWMLGAALFAHCASFLAVSYFGQIVMILFLTLAAIASLSPPDRRLVTARTRARQRSSRVSKSTFPQLAHPPIPVRTCRSADESPA